MSNGDESDTRSVGKVPSDRRQEALLEGLVILDDHGLAIRAKDGKRGAEREEVERALRDALDPTLEASERILANNELAKLAGAAAETALRKQRWSRSKGSKATALAWSEERERVIEGARDAKERNPEWEKPEIARFLERRGFGKYRKIRRWI